MEAAVRGLISEMEAMPVIDAHEHLPREEELTSQKADVFTRLLSHYLPTNVESAGLANARELVRDTARPLEERWALFRPYLPAVRDTGYARPAFIAACDIYGVDDISDETYVGLSERIQAANTPGLYRRVLRDRCRIERVLNQGSWDDGPRGYAVRVHRGFIDYRWDVARDVCGVYGRWKERHGGHFADAGSWVDFWLQEVVKEGCVGLKYGAGRAADLLDEPEAGSLFRKVRDGSLSDDEAAPFSSFLAHKSIEKAPDHGLVAAVHCGLNWSCWADFRQSNPLNVVPLLLRYRRTTFDLYHAGIPWVREMAVIGNQYPNAHLNLAWCYQISPYMTENVLNEWLDLVPANKIIGFGGDYHTGPEKTYGALVLAREAIARALAVRVVRRQMGESRAADLCRALLYENPRRIYGLDLR
jgi:predicted TIM-barrel fold metal-dependent hydrolase